MASVMFHTEKTGPEPDLHRSLPLTGPNSVQSLTFRSRPGHPRSRPIIYRSRPSPTQTTPGIPPDACELGPVSVTSGFLVPTWYGVTFPGQTRLLEIIYRSSAGQKQATPGVPWVPANQNVIKVQDRSILVKPLKKPSKIRRLTPKGAS